MKITKVTPLVLGTAWRNLTFVKVETDEGLIGVGEARVLNRTEAVLGYLAEAMPRYVLGSDPFEIEQLVQRMFRERLRPRRRDRDDRHRADRDRLLGHHGQGARPAGLPAAGRRGARSDQGLRQRLVHRRAHAGGVPRRGQTRRRQGLPGAQVRPVRRRLLRAGARREAALDRRWSRPCAMRSGRTSRSWSRCTAGSARRPPSRWRDELAPFQPSWFEEPVPPENLPALKKVVGAHRPAGHPDRDRRAHPHLYEFRELFELQAADIIQPDITHFGGLLQREEAGGLGRDVLRAGRAAQRRRAGLDGGRAAPGRLHAELQDPGALQRLRRGLGQGGCAGVPEVVDGYFALPAGPGLGVTLDEDVIAAHPQAARALQPVRRRLAEAGRRETWSVNS